MLGWLILAVAVPFGLAQSNDALQGEWRLVSYDHGRGLKKADTPVNELKMISVKHFIWVLFDSAKKKTLASANGTYTLQGESYVEHVDFIDVDPKLIGKDQLFTVRVNGDTLLQSGVLSDGTKIAETWEKVK